MIVELDVLKASIADLKQLLKSFSGDKQRAGGLDQRRCWTCKEIGHISRFCDQRDQHGFAGRRCFSCGDVGHIQRFCSQRKQHQMHTHERRCFACGDWGHIQRRCRKRDQRIDLDGIVSCSGNDGIGETGMAWKSSSGHEMRRQSNDVERQTNDV